MKTNPNSKPPEPSELTNNTGISPEPETPHKPETEEQEYNFDELEIDRTLVFLEKIKKINKHHYTELKSKNKKFNQLFAVMSEFFMNGKKKNIQKQQEQKYKTIESRHKKLQSNINKIFNLSNETPEIEIPKEQEVSENSNFKQSELNFMNKSKICYICRKSYTEIDNFYARHCPKCSILSKEKRFQSANLTNLTALVTGSRIKIGYEITLKLLRDGATVYATTRFTHDALFRYQKENDYKVWKDRLFLIQCDLLSSQQVKHLVEYIKNSVKHLDILIHNAAQTLTRPVEFYTFELQNEEQTLSTEDNNKMIKFENKCYPSLELQSHQSQQNILEPASSQAKPKINTNMVDEFGQPLDLREKNTWREKINEVSLEDCLSTQIINSTVPFYITGQLKCIMGGEIPSYVINVSSMEGAFYREHKTCFHPHTNMAKASMNMITRTCASDLAKENIFMNSVDTGWVTNENPIQIEYKMKLIRDFNPPLDCIEGAMRCIDPIYEGVRSQKFFYGKFLKDYTESKW